MADRHQCLDCSRSFGTATGLNIHRGKFHQAPGRRQCEAIGWGDATSLVAANPTEAARLLVDLSRRLEFVEILSDGGELRVNGVPWREMYSRLEAIVSDPAWDDERRIEASPVPEVTRSFLHSLRRRQAENATSDSFAQDDGSGRDADTDRVER